MNRINSAHQKINKSSRLDRRLSSPKRPFSNYCFQVTVSPQRELLHSDNPG